MDFSFSEEQVLLRDSVDRFVADHCDVDRHRRLSREEPGFDPAAWQQFAELGWLGVPFDESLGGFGGSAVDVMVICQALGRGLVREPYLHTVITAGALLRHAGSDEQRSAHVPKIIDGSSQWAFAFAESGGGYDLADVALSASIEDGAYRLEGHKTSILNGHCADHLLVLARTAGEPGDREGLSLLLVNSRCDGVSLTPFRALDGSLGAELSLAGARVGRDCLLGPEGGALPLVEAAVDDAILAIGAEAVGSMQVLLDTTAEYTRTRQQFGQPIGKFQALQHRMADMYLVLEETRSLVYHAAIRLAEASPEAPLACAALKVKLAEAGRLVSQQAVQLHGGIGMTDELSVGHHFKRLLLLSKLFGDGDYHLRRYMALAA